MERYFKKVDSLPKDSIHTEESGCGEGGNIFLDARSEPDKLDYRTRIGEFVDCIRLILRMGWPLCGLEFEEERRETDFAGLVKLRDSYKHPNGVVPRTDDDYLPEPCGLYQESIVSVAAIETTTAITDEIGDDVFGIHYASFHDVKYSDQVAVVFRYVDKEGSVKERFISINEVTEISASTLKEAVDCIISSKTSRIRGQSYDAEPDKLQYFNDLKDLIVEESKSAYYTHCFTKQLHSTLVSAARAHIDVACCGEAIADILKYVEARCEKKDGLEKKEKQAARIVQVLTNSEVSGEELLCVSTRVANTRWGFNYEMLVKLVDIFFPVIEVLGFVEKGGIDVQDRVRAGMLLGSLDSFNFVFHLLLMRSVLGITHELSLALDKKDPDLVSAMSLVPVCKQRLQIMRDEGWEAFLAEVSSFCRNYEIDVPSMDDPYRFPSRPPRVPNFQHYRDETFYSAIDSQLKVLNSLFDERTTDLLLCVACLSPSNSFHAFDKLKLVKMAQLYPEDFSSVDCLALKHQLENYIHDMRSDQRFLELNTLSDLSRKLVETKKHIVYPLVYLLLKLALVLPITAPVEERTVSAMKLIETKLSNQICDCFMSECLVTYIEREVFGSISDETIINSLESDD